MLTGRQDELAEIASFGDRDQRLPVAGRGRMGGKDVAAGRGDDDAAGRTSDVVCYFLSRREADADSSRFLAAAVLELAFLLEEDPPAAELHQFRALWEQGHHQGRPGTAAAPCY